MRPGANGTVRVKPAFFAACSTPAAPASDQIRQRDALAAGLRIVEGALYAFQLGQRRGELRRLIDRPVFCGARRMRAPLAPPRLSEPRKLEAEAQAVETSADTDRPEASTAFFSAAMSCSSISG